MPAFSKTSLKAATCKTHQLQRSTSHDKKSVPLVSKVAIFAVPVCSILRTFLESSHLHRTSVAQRSSSHDTDSVCVYHAKLVR
jgi:hypothetical protein